MNKTDKERFVRELTESIQKEVIGEIEQMPEEWDGIELRELLADKFHYERHMGRQKGRYRKRLKDYRNEVAVRNL